MVGPPVLAKPHWLGNSIWQARVDISRVCCSPSITAVSFGRDGGEGIWRGDRPRLSVAWDPRPPMLLQVEQGPTREIPLCAPGTLSFCPPGVTLRSVSAAERRRVQAFWDTNLYSALLPELDAAASRFEFRISLQDPLLSQIVAALAEETENGFMDKILAESLGTALCIRLARHFVGPFPLPASNGLSSERLQRVREYIEEHLDDNLSLTALAEVAALSPHHFSRSFKHAIGIGPHRYVTQRRIQRAKQLLRQTRRPIASIAESVGLVNQSHLSVVFRRETGVTPGQFRAASA